MECEWIAADIARATHVEFARGFYEIIPAGCCSTGPKSAVFAGSFVDLYDSGNLTLSVRKDRMNVANLQLVRKKDPVKLAVSHVMRGYSHAVSGVHLDIRHDFHPEHDAFRVTIEGL